MDDNTRLVKQQDSFVQETGERIKNQSKVLSPNQNRRDGLRFSNITSERFHQSVLQDVEAFSLYKDNDHQIATITQKNDQGEKYLQSEENRTNQAHQDNQSNQEQEFSETISQLLDRSKVNPMFPNITNQKEGPSSLQDLHIEQPRESRAVKGDSSLEENSLFNKIRLFDSTALKEAKKHALNEKSKRSGMASSFKQEYENWNIIYTELSKLYNIRCGTYNGSKDDSTISQKLKSINDSIDKLGTKSKKILEVRNEMKKHIDRNLWPSISLESV